MLHTPAQYTPRQMLENAHRAEAEAKLDHAVQLYWHIAETFPHSAEGAEAKSSLARLGQFAPAQTQGQPQPMQGATQHYAGGPPQHAYPQSAAFAQPGYGYPAHPQAHPGQGLHPGAGAGAAPFAMPNVIAKAEPRQPAPATPPRQKRLPAVRAAYGAGRLLAVTTSTLGWLLLLAALASPAAFVMGVMPAELSLAGFAGLVLALAGAGLLALLAAQVATALFDQADATRELVAFERAKWGGEQGQDA